MLNQSNPLGKIKKSAKTLLGGTLISTALISSALMSTSLNAAVYQIDTQGAHAFVQFKISHLGFSWLYGRFNQFEGTFNWDKDKPAASSINMKVNTKSLDSNHAERDKHLRDKDFLNVSKFPEARFESTKIVPNGKDKATVTGNLTLFGVTKPITLDAVFIGEGKDPWGGYRAGFEARTTFKPGDFGMPGKSNIEKSDLELVISVEGIRK